MDYGAFFCTVRIYVLVLLPNLSPGRGGYWAKVLTAIAVGVAAPRSAFVVLVSYTLRANDMRGRGRMTFLRQD